MFKWRLCHPQTVLIIFCSAQPRPRLLCPADREKPTQAENGETPVVTIQTVEAAKGGPVMLRQYSRINEIRCGLGTSDGLWRVGLLARAATKNITDGAEWNAERAVLEIENPFAKALTQIISNNKIINEMGRGNNSMRKEKAYFFSIWIWEWIWLTATWVYISWSSFIWLKRPVKEMDDWGGFYFLSVFNVNVKRVYFDLSEVLELFSFRLHFLFYFFEWYGFFRSVQWIFNNRFWKGYLWALSSIKKKKSRKKKSSGQCQFLVQRKKVLVDWNSFKKNLIKNRTLQTKSKKRIHWFIFYFWTISFYN